MHSLVLHTGHTIDPWYVINDSSFAKKLYEEFKNLDSKFTVALTPLEFTKKLLHEIPDFVIQAAAEDNIMNEVVEKANTFQEYAGKFVQNLKNLSPKELQEQYRGLSSIAQKFINLTSNKRISTTLQESQDTNDDALFLQTLSELSPEIVVELAGFTTLKDLEQFIQEQKTQEVEATDSVLFTPLADESTTNSLLFTPPVDESTTTTDNTPHPKRSSSKKRPLPPEMSAANAPLPAEMSAANAPLPTHPILSPPDFMSAVNTPLSQADYEALFGCSKKYRKYYYSTW